MRIDIRDDLRSLDEIATSLEGALPNLASHLALRGIIQRIREQTNSGYIPEIGVIRAEFTDLLANKVVEVEIKHDGSVVWLNVDGQCALRVSNPEHQVLVNDARRDAGAIWTEPAEKDGG